MRDLILEIRNGTFAYEENRCAISNINVKIYKGEKIAIIGSNGAGKSTFFLALTGVVHLDEGNLFFHGKRIERKRRDLLELRRNVGIVFQDPDNQMIASTVEGEISFGLFNIGQKSEEVRKNVEDIMKEMSLTEFANRPPHFLSGGEKKRVSIADILVMKPEIVLFDEPTASLDYKNAQVFKECIEKLHEEHVTLVVSTHDMNFVWEWANRVIVFSNGEIIADNVPEVIFADESLVEKVALQKPLLFEISQDLLDDHKEDKMIYPKSVKEFKALLGRK